MKTEGRNAVIELLKTGKPIEKILIEKGDKGNAPQGSLSLIFAQARKKDIRVQFVDKRALDKMSETRRHQGVIAFTTEYEYFDLDDIIAEKKSEKGGFIVLCDGIEDPHNLGAIIRTAECSGVHGVIIPKRRAVGLTSTVAKSSAGALSHMRIAKVTNLAVTLDELKERGLWAYAADMDGTDYRSTDMRGGAVIVLGSEGFGISRLVKEKCDFVVSIKMYGQVNSMNVSCAAAVILTEAAHQRNN